MYVNKHTGRQVYQLNNSQVNRGKFNQNIKVTYCIIMYLNKHMYRSTKTNSVDPGISPHQIICQQDP